MNAEQEKQLIRHVYQHDMHDFEMIAAWASGEFGFTVTAQECKELFCNSLQPS